MGARELERLAQDHSGVSGKAEVRTWQLPGQCPIIHESGS